MTIKRTAYDTLAGIAAPQNDADLPIKTAVTAGELQGSKPVVEIERVKTHYIESIPQLVFPRVVTVENEQRVFIDQRSTLSISERGTPGRVQNRPEHEFRRFWAAYQYRWITESSTALRALPNEVIAAYARWLSGGIIKRASLDFHQIMPVRVLCAFYYTCQFQDEPFGDLGRVSIYRMVARAAGCAPENVFQILGDLDYIGSLSELCDALRARVESSRLKDLTGPFLINLVNRTWFGTADNFVVGAALEHPPTWLALVTVVLNNNVYKNTGIARAVEEAVPSRNSTELALTMRRASQVERLVSGA